LIGAGLGVGQLLHRLRRDDVGRALGVVGTVLIVLSFGYSLRKRGVFRAGSPRVLLRVHQVMAWSGALAILAHAGLHVHALLPWIAVAAMLAAVTTGMVGELLLGGARARLADRAAMLRAGGLVEKEIERRLMRDVLALEALETWRVVHLP